MNSEEGSYEFTDLKKNQLNNYNVAFSWLQRSKSKRVTLKVLQSNVTLVTTIVSSYQPYYIHFPLSGIAEIISLGIYSPPL